MRKFIIVLVMVILMATLCGFGKRQTEESVQVKFPFEEVRNLPTEPDWQIDAEAWQILKNQKELEKQPIKEFIKDGLKKYEDGFDLINRSGDRMLHIGTNKNLEEETYFQSKEGNLIIIKESFYGIHRFEYFSDSHKFNGYRECIGISERINGMKEADKSYQHLGKMYYYLQEGNTYRNVAIGECDRIWGKCYKEDICFPVIQQDGEICAYVIEGAKASDFVYKTEEGVELKRINFSSAKTCRVYMQPKIDGVLETDGKCVEVQLDGYTLQIKLDKDKSEQIPLSEELPLTSEWIQKITQAVEIANSDVIFYMTPATK
ncbi:MAG: hypothetical protein ACLU84_00740 [Clostridia bacterium]